MAINLDFYEHIRGVLADDLDDHLSEAEILAMAADWMSGQHAWQFLVRPLRLSLRGTVTLADATYTHATRTLTLAGAFEDYEHVPGDHLEPTAGTDVELQGYEIESRTDDDSIVLATPGLGAAADAATDIDATIPCDRIALPSDFLAFPAMRPLWTADAITGGISFCDFEVLEQRRSGGLEVDASWAFLAAVQHRVDRATGALVPVLEHYPGSSVARRDAFRGAYRARILIDETDEEAVVPLSDSPLIAACLKKACRAFALGLDEGEEADKASLEQLLARLVNSDLWRAARKRDGNRQATVGPMRGGVGSMDRSRYRRNLSTRVEGPS